MDIRKIDQGTWRLSRGEGQGSIHNYLLAGQHKAVLIDTGLMKEPLREIAESLTNKPIIVINTHGHIDHIGNNELFDVSYLHPKDLALMKQHSSASYRDLFFRSQTAEQEWGDGNQLELFIRQQAQTINQTSIKTIRLLEEGMLIDLGERPLRIIEIPGHTEGCVAIMDETRQRIYTGDMVCEKGVLMHFDHSTSLEEYQTSLRKLKAILTPEYRLYPGHQQTPLTVDWIDDYLMCCQEIIQEQENKPSQLNAESPVLLKTVQRATISYLG